MADRYWVGGAGTWNATSTANWSATSGGAAGASAPTSADNVIFNTLSNLTAYAVTIGLPATPARCLDVSISGPATGNVTITYLATSVLNVHGSWLNAATGVAFSNGAGCGLNFLATTTGKTVTTNNISLGAILVVFNGVGGYWTLGSALTITGGQAPNIVAGTFDTGGFAMTLNSLFSNTTTNVRAIKLNASVISCSGNGAVNLAATNLTFDAGTSTINCSGVAPTLFGANKTFYNVNFTSTTGASTTTITGNNTFNNLNQTSPVSNRRIMSVGNSLVVTGTLTLGAANAYNARVQVINTNVGSPITLTVGTIATLADVDFRDVVAAGTSIALGNWSGTRLGNGLGNTNITFDAGKTVYWNLVAGSGWSANAWATSSGGAAATANFPLAQDTAIIDNAGLTASNTITYDSAWWLGTLNSTRTAAWTFVFSAAPTMYGDFTLTTLTTTSGAANLTFIGRGATQTLTTNGVSLTSPIAQQSVGGTLLLNGSVTSINATSGLTLFNGTLNLNGYTLTCSKLSSSNTNLRAIAFGTGKIILTGSGDLILNIDTATSFSYTGSGNIEATYSGSVGERYFVIANASGGSNAVAMSLKVTAGTDLINIYRYWRNVDFTGFAGTWRNSGDKILSGDLTMSSGMTLQAAAGQSMTFDRTGTQTITSGTQTFTNLLLYSEQIDNVNWPKTNTTVTADAIVAPDSTTTADLVLDTVTAGVEHYVSQNIFTTTNQPYVQSVYVKASVAPSFLFMVVSVGASSITSAITFTQTAGVYAPATTTNGLITSATATSVGNGWYRCSVRYTLNGTVTAHQMRLYPYLGGLYTGTGIGTYFWGAQAEIGATLTTYIPTTATTASITGNRIIDYPVTFSNSGTTNCLDALTLGSTRGLTFTGGTLNLKSGVTSTVNSFVTTGTTLKYLGSTTLGTQATISDVSGTNTATYLTILDSNATGGATWIAGTATSNGGNNTGWTFAAPGTSTGSFLAVFRR